MANAINWFEIPASDFERAKKFYESILVTELIPSEDTKGFQMGLFPVQDGVGGAIIKGKGFVPSVEGSVVYLNAGDDLNVVLGRVEAAGGQVILPKTSLGENGYFAYFKDSEGNKVGLNSMG